MAAPVTTTPAAASDAALRHFEALLRWDR